MTGSTAVLLPLFDALLVRQHFERTVVPQTCNGLVPKVEEQYDNLAAFFSQACIPGDWSRNDFRDKLLSGCQRFPYRRA